MRSTTPLMNGCGRSTDKLSGLSQQFLNIELGEFRIGNAFAADRVGVMVDERLPILELTQPRRQFLSFAAGSRLYGDLLPRDRPSKVTGPSKGCCEGFEKGPAAQPDTTQALSAKATAKSPACASGSVAVAAIQAKLLRCHANSGSSSAAAR